MGYLLVAGRVPPFSALLSSLVLGQNLGLEMLRGNGLPGTGRAAVLPWGMTGNNPDDSDHGTQQADQDADQINQSTGRRPIRPAGEDPVGGNEDQDMGGYVLPVCCTGYQNGNHHQGMQHK